MCSGSARVRVHYANAPFFYIVRMCTCLKALFGCLLRVSLGYIQCLAIYNALPSAAALVASALLNSAISSAAVLFKLLYTVYTVPWVPSARRLRASPMT